MKRVIFIAAALTLTACATSSAYGPKGSGSTGFTTQKVEKDRFRVSYTAPDHTQARDLALLRAAEVTRDNGYDWFRVIDGRLSPGQQTGRKILPRPGVGVGVGRGGNVQVRPRVNLGLGLGDVVRLTQGQRATSSLEIVTGSGAKPADPDVYSAQEIIKNIRPETFK